jgi:hypothetical protein
MPDELPDDVVAMDDFVTYRTEGGLFPHPCPDLPRGPHVVSGEHLGLAPLGTALLGQRPGDRIAVEGAHPVGDRAPRHEGRKRGACLLAQWPCRDDQGGGRRGPFRAALASPGGCASPEGAGGRHTRCPPTPRCRRDAQVRDSSG